MVAGQKRLGMPLNAEREGVVGEFDGFDNAIGGDRASQEPVA